LAKANAQPSRREIAAIRPGFAALTADGGSRTSPPAAAIGYVLKGVDGAILASHNEVIGPVSAVVAEYRALLAGLLHAHELGLAQLDARSDSRVLVSHLAGERRPNNPKLVALGDQILDVTTRIGSVIVTWIPSSASGSAHSLVTDALAHHDPGSAYQPGG
jgi:ribonuclease H / adenosylcobalamin/alpha-ribazole phosphatase